jgi:hypothetical protein
VFHIVSEIRKEHLMQRASVPTVRLIALLISLTAQAACTPSDYADGITAFSTAVDKANSAEQALIATYQQNTLDQTAAQVAGGNLSYGRPDLVKCRGNPGPYHAGDCVVQFGGQAAPVTAGPSSLASLTKYAELLSSVVTDKTCDTLDTDAKGLATSIGDIANDARNPSLAVPAAALATIVSAIGCGVIETAQHYCPEFSERISWKYLTYNGFLAILGGADLKLVAVSLTLFRGRARPCTPVRRYSRS